MARTQRPGTIPSPRPQRQGTTPTPPPQRDQRAGRTAPGRHRPVAPDPGWGPDPAAGGRPDHPGHPTRPTRRPDGAGRRLCLPQLPPPPGLVRSPPLAALAPWRPHRPGQSGLAVPSPPPRRPRGRLAAATRSRWPADRHAAASATSQRRLNLTRKAAPSMVARQARRSRGPSIPITAPGPCMAPDSPTHRARQPGWGPNEPGPPCQAGAWGRPSLRGEPPATIRTHEAGPGT